MAEADMWGGCSGALQRGRYRERVLVQSFLDGAVAALTEVASRHLALVALADCQEQL